MSPMLGAVHVSPVVSITTGALLWLVLVWYWMRLGKPDVPRTRRRIRRVSSAIMFVTLLALIAALSYLDDQAHRGAYMLTWAIVTLLLLMVIATAFIDAANNLRLHREARHRAVVDAASDILRTADAQETDVADPVSEDSTR